MKTTNVKVGILGGGQLGKMFALAAHNWDVETWALDASRSFPTGPVCSHFVEGNFNNYDDVYAFGKQVDVLTIEIEHVNTEALLRLESEGVKVHPAPAQLNLIKDKGLQKEFYLKNGLPTSDFKLYESGEAIREALQNGQLSYPFVQKSRTAGYDGKGVAVIKSAAELPLLLPDASVVEDLVDIQVEIAVVVARNERGEVKAFPAVEMEFNPVANLVEFLVCPADLDPAIEKEAEQMALDCISAYGICGLLAVELFLTKDNQLLINEVAPRPHNSGHHTIDSCYTSQFEQHLRGILDLPLGSTKMKTASVMVNLLGEPGHTGPVRYAGFEEAVAMEGVKIHLYGKADTKPYRKMGHVTVLAEEVEAAKAKARKVQQILKVIS
ncbi:MAG: 5-(carboxyamino)imidazole ribonucleotide synthase [Saprospiraceae bacterium]|nr:5-(carboxyamino)imidazole ribonucleotide synthase [Saprospiraceae bacterium]MCF8249833.1 5-(carboxyamino)imidazole ribonucleotide synthase [Saprospiraceae bacterium]MCF8279497.1 5-(carboxyamino)imidazole ribonucleotide synthase [Bacteroidales bacterium]MCF8311733.1 5-(carboxyamino)imidazole ribonucleotide synthase [Saprospiraceae bacterium]MCF8440300.1 5-(carboxyamino)imidazole ribonucleotide synthase [Saprospiraceae bacterium]